MAEKIAETKKPTQNKVPKTKCQKSMPAVPPAIHQNSNMGRRLKINK